MKILVLSRYTRMGASSRLRLMQYIPELENEEVNIEVFPFFDDKHLNSQYGNTKSTIFDIIKYFYKRFYILRLRSAPDLIWLEYEVLPWIPWFIEKLLLPRGVPIISDYDDAIFHRYDSHRFKTVRFLLGNKIKTIMKSSKLVIAGNSYLADYARKSHTRNIEIIPTVVNLDVYKTKNSKKNKKIRVGWIGTPMTFDTYLQSNLPMLESLALTEDFQITVMGAKKNISHLYPLIEFEDWSEDKEVSFIQSLDIGIMPLNDSPWARGKCGYKIVQYMACGIPVVASQVGVNRNIVKHEINGFLTKTKDDWKKYIKILANDGNLRQQMGNEGRKLVEIEFSLQSWSPRIRDMFQEIVDKNNLNKFKNNKIEKKTILSFGDEWRNFNQKKLIGKEYIFLFKKYFNIFPWDLIPKNACGFDMGCGSGRWALLVAPRIGKLTCIDPSSEAIRVAKKNLAHLSNTVFKNASVFDQPLPINSQDFGYCLGVLHHIKDTEKALKECVKMLKPGAPFLIYIYYNFENRPFWYYITWFISDIARRFISKLPSWLKLVVTDILATAIYFPLARFSLIAEKIGFNVDTWILSSYRRTSFYTMRTDSRDRFGTPLEKRFNRLEINLMMKKAGLEKIHFSENSPFWCAVGIKSLNQT